MKLKKLIAYLESVAPPMYQESYDNSGLLVGKSDMHVKGVLTCLDSTEAVLDEAIERGFNVIVAHHPIIFKGLKRLTGQTYVERVIQKAIKHDLAIYAIHTNLDNVYQHGVNGRIATQLGLENTQILSPKRVLKQLQARVSVGSVELLRKRLLEVGGSDCSVSLGVSDGSAVMELRLLYPMAAERAIRTILDTEVACVYNISTVENVHTEVGSGMIGELKEPLSMEAFLLHLKKEMGAAGIRHTELLDRKVRSVAVCGGSGGFLLPQAIAQGADVFVTADYKYHEFFDADQRIVIADIGHYESEQYTVDLLCELICDKFTTFAVYKTTVSTNPVYYF